MKPTHTKRSRRSSKKTQKVSASTVRRLSKYYRTLNDLLRDGIEHVSSEELARIDGFTSAQVRKDFAYFGNFGKRGLGYNVIDLRNQIANILGLNRQWNVAIVGAGNIGSALIDYGEFAAHGFNVRLILDNDPCKVGASLKSLIVRDAEALREEFRRENIEIAILAVPAEAAQAVAEKVVAAGVRAILNFAPRSLNVPRQVAVRQENTAMELEALTFSIMNREPLSRR